MDMLIGLVVIAYGEWCQICDLQSRFSFGPGTRLDHSRAFGQQSFIKGTEKSSDIDIRRGTGAGDGECPHQVVLSRPYIFYQTHSHNTHLKMTGLVRKFSRRRNMSWSKLHCYIDYHKMMQEKKVCLFLLESPRPLSSS